MDDREGTLSCRVYILWVSDQTTRDEGPASPRASRLLSVPLWEVPGGVGKLIVVSHNDDGDDDSDNEDDLQVEITDEEIKSS